MHHSAYARNTGLHIVDVRSFCNAQSPLLTKNPICTHAGMMVLLVHQTRNSCGQFCKLTYMRYDIQHFTCSAMWFAHWLLANPLLGYAVLVAEGCRKIPLSVLFISIAAEAVYTLGMEAFLVAKPVCDLCEVPTCVP